ncbi:hypothetical protein WKI68_02830 [Streptomyces sp. MS1.HAVA.3]|uniref:Uncharacterized protein n=1 Tax=Streptomyces caledonius TaxID=3134107 RepID=A0ABU8TYG4_9ACTN
MRLRPGAEVPPRTRAQLRARRIAAARTGTPLAVLLGRPDPLETR